MTKIYVKTNYVPEEVDYLTINKVYEAVWLGKKERVASIQCDDGDDILIILDSCAHLDDKPWTVVTEEEYLEQETAK